MNRARPESSMKKKTSRKTAVPASGGCLSLFSLPLLSALLVSALLAALSLRLPRAQAQVVTAPVAQAGHIAPLFTPEVQFWAAWLQQWAAQAGVDPNLAATVMQIESCGHPEIRSNAGAGGLFQVMPFHFSPQEDVLDPQTNARRGLDYLRRSVEGAAGDTRQALAGYNGGLGLVGRSESLWPAETQRYVYWGTGIYADAAQGAASSLRLQEWLTAGGDSLCQKARMRLGISVKPEGQ